MNAENPELQKEIARAGIDFGKCQIDSVVQAYQEGRPVEFESFSPYASSYDMVGGDIHKIPLTNGDATGILIAQKMRSIFPEARMISLYDEYNTMPDTSDVFGAPASPDDEAVGQVKLDESVKRNFRQSIEQLLREKLVITEQDQEGQDFLFVSESSKADDAEKLVARLEAEGFIKRDGKKITFVNSQAESPTGQKISLRNAAGHWRCAALDASSYLDPKNLDTTHLVILPNSFKKQQDETWELLKSLGIQPKNYHNIFFDAKLSPEAVAEVIADKFNKAKQSNLEMTT